MPADLSPDSSNLKSLTLVPSNFDGLTDMLIAILLDWIFCENGENAASRKVKAFKLGIYQHYLLMWLVLCIVCDWACYWFHISALPLSVSPFPKLRWGASAFSVAMTADAKGVFKFYDIRVFWISSERTNLRLVVEENAWWLDSTAESAAIAVKSLLICRQKCYGRVAATDFLTEALWSLAIVLVLYIVRFDIGIFPKYELYQCLRIYRWYIDLEAVLHLQTGVSVTCQSTKIADRKLCANTKLESAFISRWLARIARGSTPRPGKFLASFYHPRHF